MPTGIKEYNGILYDQSDLIGGYFLCGTEGMCSLLRILQFFHKFDLNLSYNHSKL